MPKIATNVESIRRILHEQLVVGLWSARVSGLLTIKICCPVKARNAS